MFLILFCVGSVWSSEFEEIKKSAEQGDTVAQYDLGYMYYTGKGAPQDYKKATYWWTKSAEQGETLAQYDLRYMYLYGKGVPQDYKQAIYWFIKSAEQGDLDAQHNLGSMYYTGKGVSQDYKQAIRLPGHSTLSFRILQ